MGGGSGFLGLDSGDSTNAANRGQSPTAPLQAAINAGFAAQTNQAPPPVPTPQNSQSDLDAAAAAQRKAQGAAATIFSRGYGGSGGVMSGGGISSRQLLGS